MELNTSMKLLVARIYTVFVAFAVIAGYLSNSGPLNFIFVIVAGLPWTPALDWAFGKALGHSPLIAISGVAINLAIVWWWALRKQADHRPISS